MIGSHKSWRAGAVAASLGLVLALTPQRASAQFNVPGVLQQLFGGPSYDEILGHGEIAAIVRGYGYRQASRPYLRGSVYIVDATDRGGYRVRLVLSAYEGQIIDRAFIYGPGDIQSGERQAALPLRESPREMARPRSPRPERSAPERKTPERETLDRDAPEARPARPRPARRPVTPPAETAAVPPAETAPVRPVEPAPTQAPATAALPAPEERDPELRTTAPRAPDAIPAAPPPAAPAVPAAPAKPAAAPSRPQRPVERVAKPVEKPAPRVVLPNPIERPGPPAPSVASQAPRPAAPTPDVPPAALE